MHAGGVGGCVQVQEHDIVVAAELAYGVEEGGDGRQAPLPLMHMFAVIPGSGAQGIVDRFL